MHAGKFGDSCISGFGVGQVETCNLCGKIARLGNGVLTRSIDLSERSNAQQNSERNQCEGKNTLHHRDYLISYMISQALKGVSWS